MGSLIDGISTVLLAGNHLDNGTFREGSYSDQIRPPGGCAADVRGASRRRNRRAVQVAWGELCVPAAAGAVANAYARATRQEAP